MANHATKDSSAKPEFSFPPISLTNGPMLDGFMRSSQGWAKASLDWQQEVMRFVDARLRVDEQLGTAMAACKNLGDLAEVQRNWAMATAQDYFEETQRLAQIMAKAMPSWPAAAPADQPSKHKAD